MSGLINSAGSRSGVIGTTELDYEEGTWTPSYLSYSGSFTTMTMDRKDCRYVRIGNLVHISADIYTDVVTVGTASSLLYLGPLPFVTVNARGCIPFTMVQNWASNVSPVSGYLPDNNDRMYIQKRATSAGDTSWSEVSSMTAGSSADKNHIVFAGSYSCN